MQTNSLIFNMFLIFAGTALFATLALYLRQSLLVAYMILGMVLGPWGLQIVNESSVIEHSGDFGIIFLLFLLGLDLQPRSLLKQMKDTVWVTVASCIIFAAVSAGICYLFGYSLQECWIVGASMMFSSTIICLKLLPTTVLHHQRAGEIMISILLLQDLIAILVLTVMHAAKVGTVDMTKVGLIFLSLPGLLVFAFVFEHFVVAKMFARFDRIREYIFLVAIAWCLSVSVLAKLLGLTYEIGAFIAGVSIAEGPIALYIADSLKPVRDFFLVLFFFAVGTQFDLHFLHEVALPALLISVTLLLLKPFVFSVLLKQVKEEPKLSWEIGWRLGQVSEFSLLVGYVAFVDKLIGASASYLIQATAILTFLFSSYIVVLRYPTPVAISDKLRRD